MRCLGNSEECASVFLGVQPIQRLAQIRKLRDQAASSEGGASIFCGLLQTFVVAPGRTVAEPQQLQGDDEIHWCLGQSEGFPPPLFRLPFLLNIKNLNMAFVQIVMPLLKEPKRTVQLEAFHGMKRKYKYSLLLIMCCSFVLIC